MKCGIRTGVLSLALSLVSMPAAAKLCGDAVEGKRVPCACGDTVVTDVALSDDPVTTTVCSGDGLIVRAADASTAITIDLQGKTLRGTGHGAGVWLLLGGAEGARLISTGGRATIDGFRDGIVGHGSGTVAVIENVVVARNARDGVRVNGFGYQVRASEARDSGRDGFSLGGKSFQLTSTHA